MALIKLIARRGFLHEGRTYRAGEVFEAPAVHASVLVWRHHAAFAPPTSVVTPEPSRRPTKRRDVTPEPVEPAAHVKRRDLIPEDAD